MKRTSRANDGFFCASWKRRVARAGLSPELYAARFLSCCSARSLFATRTASAWYVHARSINMSLALASSVRAASAITFLTLSVISAVVSMGLAGRRKSGHCSAKTVTELQSSPQVFYNSSDRPAISASTRRRSDRVTPRTVAGSVSSAPCWSNTRSPGGPWRSLRLRWLSSPRTRCRAHGFR